MNDEPEYKVLLDQWLRDNPEYFLIGIRKKDYGSEINLKLGISNMILSYDFSFDIDPLYLISYLDSEKAIHFDVPDETSNSRQIRLFEGLRES